MFLKLDGTFWFQLINFAIFFAVLNAVFLRPVGAAIKQRREYIDSVTADFNKAEAEVKASKADADQKRAAARREADETIGKARASGENEAAAILSDRGAEAASITELARATVATELAVARSRSDELAAGLAKTLVDRAVGETV